MKKIITLFFAVASVAAAHAQTSREEARRVILGEGSSKQNPKQDNGTSQNPRDVILGGGNTGNNYPSTYPSGSSRAERIDAINREYDAKVYSIRNNPNFSAAEKDRMIRYLEKERARKISRINGNYENEDDNYTKKGKKDNPGKHKGWYKGKGNKGKNKHGEDNDNDD